MGARRTLAVLAALAAASVASQSGWCGDASAGVVRVEHRSITFEDSHGPMTLVEARIVYDAAPGEANDVTMSGEGRGATVHDGGAPVTAGPECEQIGPHDARCAVTGTDASITALVNAGDGDDRVQLVSGAEQHLEFGANGAGGDDTLRGATGDSLLDGGPGNDALTAGDGSGNVLLGGPGADTLLGGAGPDTLYGGADADVLTGGAGRDQMTGDGGHAPPSPDSIDGGQGIDTISYTDRSVAVNVDLQRRDGNGQREERDSIVGVENVTGGGGSDRLAGDARSNELVGQGFAPYPPADDHAPAVRGEHDVLIGRRGADVLNGSPGSDLLLGGAQDDRLVGGSGRDRLVAGPGDDILDIVTGRPAALDCGGGNDVVYGAVRTDVVRDPCETVGLDEVGVSSRLRRKGGAVLIPTRQRADPSIVPSCRARVRLVSPKGRRGHRTSLGVGVVRLRVGVRHDVRVALSGPGRRRLRAGRRVTVEVRLRGLDSCNPRNDSGSLLGAFTLATRVRI